eukprot:GHVP01000087.1.p1 GENE.GHVP01000087.1~~GHVP01000087.1.p1  ORF type:complete len:661 (+),score=85.50 GHVP01000087.1:50-2032(+)
MEELQIRTEKDFDEHFESLEPPKKSCIDVAKSYFYHNFGLRRLFPFATILKGYNLANFLLDVSAGISEGIMGIPQGMSYAILAGLPAVHGLYNNLLYPIPYLFLGSSKHASIGVSAIEAILIKDTVSSLLGHYEGSENTQDRMRVSFAMSTAVGIILVVLRIVKFGVVAEFISDSALSGFMSASALIILISQLPACLGISVDSSQTLVKIYEILSQLNDVKWEAIVISISTLCCLFVVRLFNNKFCFTRVILKIPGPLLVIVLSIIFSHFLNLDQVIDTVGDIPKGLPNFTLPWELVDPYEFRNILTASVPASIMLYVIHVSIVRSYAREKDYSVDAQQELFSLGITNLFGGFFSCFPNATSLSRTSVVAAANSQTPLHGVVNSFLLLLTILWLTPIFRPIPMATLSAVVIFGVYSMIKISKLKHLRTNEPIDSAVWVVTFILTLCVGTMVGVVSAMILSVLWLLQQISRPDCKHLGKIPGTCIYRSVEGFPSAVPFPGISILSFSAPLTFANAEFVEKKIEKTIGLSNDNTTIFTGCCRPKKNKGLEDQSEVPKIDELSETENSDCESRPPPIPKWRHCVIIDASSWVRVDYTGICTLDRLRITLEKENVLFLFCNWSNPARNNLRRSKFFERLNSEYCFLSLDMAVCFAWQEMTSIPN